MASPQLEMLQGFQKKHGNFKVMLRTSYGFWTHMDFPSEQAEYFAEKEQLTDRQILPDEIVVETDLATSKINWGVMRNLHNNKFQFFQLNYEIWHSGNKSYHAHFIFPELVMVGKEDRKLLKELFLLWLFDFDKQKAVKNYKLDLSLAGNHAIRLENSYHPKTDRRKSFVKRYFNIPAISNVLPPIVWSKFREIKVKQLGKPYRTFSDSQETCVDYLMSTPLPDCRQRVAFIIFNKLKKKLGVDMAEEMLFEWNRVINGNYLTPVQLRAVVRSGMACELVPGCNYIKSVLYELGAEEVCKRCKR